MWWATEGRHVGVQVGQLLLQSFDLPSESSGLALLLLPEAVGPVHDALALADVLLQGLDLSSESLAFGQGLHVIHALPARRWRFASCPCWLAGAGLRLGRSSQGAGLEVVLVRCLVHDGGGQLFVVRPEVRLHPGACDLC